MTEDLFKIRNYNLQQNVAIPLRWLVINLVSLPAYLTTTHQRNYIASDDT
jgi:hypothetical protein